MRYLIVVRHGESGDDGHLSYEGNMEIARLAARLEEYIRGGTVRILSSPTDRAAESAEVFDLELDATLKIHDELSSDDRRPENHEAVLELVRSCREADTVILVTHHGYTERFPSYFGRHVLSTTLESYALETAEAWVIDCEEKTLTLIRK